MTLSAIALALWTTVHPSYAKTVDAPAIAPAIGDEAADPFEAALAAYYVLRESGVRLHPNAYSADAISGASCGMLQMPCAFVAQHSPRQQVRWWLHQVRAGGLLSLDSSPTRAYARFARAMVLLATVRARANDYRMVLLSSRPEGGRASMMMNPDDTLPPDTRDTEPCGPPVMDEGEPFRILPLERFTVEDDELSDAPPRG